MLFLLFLPLFTYAGNDGELAEKKINRQFAIQSNGYVELENKYGNLDIAIGESNQVQINVTISARASTQKKAQEAIDRVSINFEEGNNRIKAVTDIESSSGWTTWFNSCNADMEINYQVVVPADVYLDLTNKYGDIFVESSNRDLKADLAYGNIRLGDIAANLDLDMSYSEGSISQIKNGNLTLSYSNLDMEDATDVNLENKYAEIQTGSIQKLSMESSYSNLHSVSVNQFEYEGKYDDVLLERVVNMNAQAGYTGIVIEVLENTGDFDMRYGDLSIENIHRGFSKVNINTSYTGVELEISDEASFSVDAETTYCDINHPEMKIAEESQRSANATFKGSRGSGGGEIIARMSYGELNIN